MRRIFFFIFLSISFSSCIGDDFVMDMQDTSIRITNAPDSIEINTQFSFEALYLNNIGQAETANLTWSSSDADIVSIDANTGLAMALQMGTSIIKVENQNDTTIPSDMISVEVGQTTVVSPTNRTGTVNTTSSYALSGDFTLSENGSDLILEFGNDYNASTALPGLYVYLSNNPNSNAGAYEIGAVQIFSGSHSYTIPNIGLNDYTYVLYYCKPFSVKVGHGEIQ